ncbi:hypothetical protein CLOSYM_02373 [[Clostridium] symbiosum ATCC 14940]|uniref:Uncharacterized protein n=1 Tax=[Clostridium] symbiosum ATCC 14940 TaxID=411472 RepID=A0ABC9TXM1_CLOSY|nr:hypothetical protein CLOSYM_02373 [[Clostridium] symbiosum ATCC 14940]
MKISISVTILLPLSLTIHPCRLLQGQSSSLQNKAKNSLYVTLYIHFLIKSNTFFPLLQYFQAD